MRLVTTFDNCGAALSVKQDSAKQRMKVKEFFIVEKTWEVVQISSAQFTGHAWAAVRLTRSRREFSESFMLDVDGIRPISCENNT